MSVPSSVTVNKGTPSTSPAAALDPIIEREDVMWAARKLILVYGDEAPEIADKEVRKFDSAGKFHVSEMFTRVGAECRLLLRKSAKLRSRKLH
ncbi:MAG: hypothetical protein MI743_05270 [Sneathiellales bacterium]|nr:hypothetical protein [Sneathiellales bacterium]